MPYYRWSGINLLGKKAVGKSFARSVKDLDALLLKRDIALLKQSIVPIRRFFSRPVPQTIKIAFFKQLAALLQAGILLPDALVILTEQIDHPAFQEIVYTLADQVSQGILLSAGMAHYSHVFDQLMVQVAHVGQESGKLAEAFNMLAEHLDALYHFNKKIRSALLMPGITLVFFVLIATAIFLGIIPRFAVMFAAANQKLPYITELLISISSGIRSWKMVIFMAVLSALFFMMRGYVRSEHGKRVYDYGVIRIPFIGPVIIAKGMLSFFKSLSMLLYAGLPLIVGIRFSKKTTGNSALRLYIQYLEQNILAGSSLSEAMGQHPEQLFCQEIVSMVKVGEETSSLGSMLTVVASKYEEQLHDRMSLCTSLLQPLLMVILGLLIAVLIFAVYLPIFNLANVM